MILTLLIIALVAYWVYAVVKYGTGRSWMDDEGDEL